MAFFDAQRYRSSDGVQSRRPALMNWFEKQVRLPRYTRIDRSHPRREHAVPVAVAAQIE
jgi:hypothetical protein